MPHRPSSISSSPVDRIHLSLRGSTVQPQSKFPPMPRAMERDSKDTHSTSKNSFIYCATHADSEAGTSFPASRLRVAVPHTSRQPRTSTSGPSIVDCCAVGCDGDHDPRQGDTSDKTAEPAKDRRAVSMTYLSTYPFCDPLFGDSCLQVQDRCRRSGSAIQGRGVTAIQVPRKCTASGHIADLRTYFRQGISAPAATPGAPPAL